MYLATVIDLATRMVVGWSLAKNMKTGLVIDALKAAHDCGYVAGNAIFHSDRGSQYTSKEFADFAASIDVRLSVGKVGVCWDNAVAESFFSMLKQHVLFGRKRFESESETYRVVGQWIEGYDNRRRIHGSTDAVPCEAMTRFLDSAKSFALAA